jgi:predicted nucleic acid-binding protein
MKVMLDTSVLVAAMVAAHAQHRRAQPWLQRAIAGNFEFLVAAHSLAELYAVLTTLPVSPRISPAAAARLVQENVLTPATIVALTATEYAQVLRHLAEQAISGGAVYDALIAKAAEKAGVDKLVTLNGEDFRRVWPAGAAKITSP